MYFSPLQEVSRSYKVETVSELEMNAFAVPSNSLGPNLMSTADSSERMSKDAQLMKWLDSSGPVTDRCVLRGLCLRTCSGSPANPCWSSADAGVC